LCWNVETLAISDSRRLARSYLNPARMGRVRSDRIYLQFQKSIHRLSNGVDWSLDWGASYFLTKQIHVGPVGYFYQQITDDRGAPMPRRPYSQKPGSSGSIGTS
jgi:hypothetical protein